MKRIVMNIVFSTLTFLGLFSCDTNGTSEMSALPSSSGKYGEILVIVDTLYENRATGEQLENIFYKGIPGMPQQEAQFRMSTVAPSYFKSILKRSRNVLKLSIGNGKKTSINIERNVWAKDQLLIQISAASDTEAARVLEKNTKTIRDYFNEEELSRLQKQFKIKPQEDLSQELQKQYGVSIIIPPAYMRMDGDEHGFWIKKEKSIGEHQIMQGLCIYFEPYIEDSVFQNQYMITERNKFTKQFIQGTRKNSFMQVYEEYKPVTQEINLNGMYAMEYRGLWNMVNDFMGGPFLHYIFVDEKAKRVIHIDGFVYAPKFNKREYLRELEAMMKTINLKEDRIKEN